MDALAKGREALGGLAGTVVGKTTAAANQAAAAVPLSEEQKAAALQAAQSALEGAQGVAAVGAQHIQTQKDRLQNIVYQFKEFLECWVNSKIQRQIETVVDKLPPIVKESTDDPDMPKFVKRGKDRAIDIVWPDFKEEIMWQVAVMLDADGKVEGEKGSGPDCVRAYLRYHIYPCDKTFWGKIKSPVWMLFTLISLIPWAGMTPLIFFFIFLLIDKTDEFQLLAFILSFKGTQFITQGIIRCITGFFQFIACVTADGKIDEHTCETKGPGIVEAPSIAICGWILQMFLIWFAWCLLPCAKEKGKKCLRGKVEFSHASNAGKRRGGYLTRLMIYDIICFAICMGVMAYIMSTRPSSRHDEWVVIHSFYAVQVVYGILSLPFFLFTLPIFNVVLTHAAPTAYDKQGRCVSFDGPPIERPAKKPISEMVSVEEAQRLMNDLQQIAMGALSGKDAAAKMKAEAEADAAAKPAGDGNNV